MKLNKIILGIGAVLVTFLLYAFCVSFFLSVQPKKVGGDITKPIEKPVKLTLTKDNPQDILDLGSLLNSCVQSGAITITKPLDDDDTIGKMMKECEKRMDATQKSARVRDGGKTNQELFNLVK